MCPERCRESVPSAPRGAPRESPRRATKRVCPMTVCVGFATKSFRAHVLGTLSWVLSWGTPWETVLGTLFWAFIKKRRHWAHSFGHSLGAPFQHLTGHISGLRPFSGSLPSQPVIVDVASGTRKQHRSAWGLVGVTWQTQNKKIKTKDWAQLVCRAALHDLCAGTHYL